MKRATVLRQLSEAKITRKWAYNFSPRDLKNIYCRFIPTFKKIDIAMVLFMRYTVRFLQGSKLWISRHEPKPMVP